MALWTGQFQIELSILKKIYRYIQILLISTQDIQFYIKDNAKQ